ncbi:MAG: hypothetical protein ACI9MU_003793 [Alphaproteobacteria bacterium]
MRVSEAPSHGKPVLLYDLACTGSQAYVHLAGEVLRRDAQKKMDNNTTQTGTLVPDSLRPDSDSDSDKISHTEAATASPPAATTDQTETTDDHPDGPAAGPTGETR